MGVSSFEIQSHEPYDGNSSWGGTGTYEVLRGTVGYSVDPKAKVNDRIVDLQYADTGPDGRVAYDADFVILRPSDPTKSNRRLLYVVNNRGRTGAVPFSANTNITPPTEIDPGDGLLLKEGWTIAYSGWQWDVGNEPGVIGIRAPEAKIAGAPIEGVLCVDFRSDVRIPHHLLSGLDRSVLGSSPYTAADVHQSEAVLTVRDSASSEQRPIDRSRWRFARGSRWRGRR